MATPPAFLGTSFDLLTLIDNYETVSGTLTVESVQARFRTHTHEFAAVCDKGRVLGLCSRAQVGALLSGRYGFALHCRTPIRHHLLPGSLTFDRTTPLRTVLTEALSRGDESFHHDVTLSENSGTLVGMISMTRLVTVQTALMSSQFGLLEEQRRRLETANEDLSRSLESQRALERKMVQKEKGALIETLVSGIAHELNNKLMPIVGYAEMLSAESRTGDTRHVGDYSGLLLESALDAARIIKQLLHLSRPSAVEREPCDLRDIVQQSLVLMAPRVHESGIELTTSLPPDQALLHADPSQLKQLIVNLVINAVDAMEGRHVRRLTVRVAVSPEATSLSLEDTGAGIAPEHISRIFDPFFTTKSPNRGTGLGLGVCAAIARQHDGDIAVESTPGIGTVFTVRLPVTGHVATPAIRRTSALPSATEAAPRRGTALLIDDNDSVARVLTAILGRCGYAVTRAANGAEAKSTIAASGFDLILCDVRMPVLGGLEVLDWLRHTKPDLVARLVLITGEGGDTATNQRIAIAGAPVLRKPFTAESLMTCIASLTPSMRRTG